MEAPMRPLWRRCLRAATLSSRSSHHTNSEFSSIRSSSSRSSSSSSCCMTGGYKHHVRKQRTVSSSSRFMTTSTLLPALLSPRNLASLEDYLSEHLGSTITDPLLNSDLRSLEWIQRRIKQTDNGDIIITLSLPTLLHPALDDLKEQTNQAAYLLIQKFYTLQSWSNPPQPSNIIIKVIATKPTPTNRHDDFREKLGPGLAHVTHFLVVYSCKGGVGKSTIAVNLAYELARLGGRIGLLDVDVYGPSLPVLIHPEDPTVRQSSRGTGMIHPIHHKGVALMSLGYVSPNSGVPGGGGAAIMRGPMAGKVVTQLLKGTEWGDLDVLILDLPPGTGDVQLSICQELPLSGAVAVSTPSKVAVSDALKGMELMASMGVSILATVENMAYFVCDGGGRHYPFGKSTLGGFEEVPNLFSLPISTATNDANDSGAPLCITRPDIAADELSVFTSLARTISKELLLVQYNSQKAGETLSVQHRVTFPGHPDVFFDVASTALSVHKTEPHQFVARFFSENGAIELTITDLRSRDPKTGQLEMVQQYKGTSKSLFPATVERKGNYGYSVKYPDGATIIYSMIAIAKAAGGAPVEA